MRQHLLNYSLLLGMSLIGGQFSQALEREDIVPEFDAEQCYYSRGYKDNQLFIVLTSAGCGFLNGAEKSGNMLRFMIQIDPEDVSDIYPIPVGDYSYTRSGEDFSVVSHSADYITAVATDDDIDAIRLDIDDLELSVSADADGNYVIEGHGTGQRYDSEGYYVEYTVPVTGRFRGIPLPLPSYGPDFPALTREFKVAEIVPDEDYFTDEGHFLPIEMHSEGYDFQNPQCPGVSLRMTLRIGEHDDLSERPIPLGNRISEYVLPNPYDYDYTGDVPEPYTIVRESFIYQETVLKDQELADYFCDGTSGFLHLYENGGVYDIWGEFSTNYVDPETGEEMDYHLFPEFIGRIGSDEPIYRPLETDDHEMQFDNMSGFYAQGYFWFSFWRGNRTDVGAFIGEGEYLHLGFNTPYDKGQPCMNFIEGTYGPAGNEKGNYEPSKFILGYVSGLNSAMGSYLTIHDGQDAPQIGCVTDGTLEVKRTGDTSISMDMNFISETGKTFKGHWEGDLSENFIPMEGILSDGSWEESGVGEIMTDPIRGMKGRIIAPADASVFTIDGRPCGTEGLAAGIYIVRTHKNSTKVIVK